MTIDCQLNQEGLLNLSCLILCCLQENCCKWMQSEKRIRSGKAWPYKKEGSNWHSGPKRNHLRLNKEPTSVAEVFGDDLFPSSPAS